MKPQDLACFDLVAKAIGKDIAIVELQKVIDCRRYVNLVIDEESLGCAFLWDSTPQGHSFWLEVRCMLD